MLPDLDKTLEKLIYRTGKINKSDVDIAFDQPTGEWSAKLSKPTLNLFCYDIRENLKLRRPDMDVTRNGDKTGVRSIPRLRFDVSYLLTAWARDPQDEHQLIWRALAALRHHPKLAPEDCEGNLRYSTYEIPLMVATQTDHPVNAVDLWSVLENQMRLGFVVLATVELDPELTIEGPLVLEATIRVGQSDRPDQMSMQALDAEIKHTAKQKKKDEDKGKEKG